ncbi:MAG: hypothetical protein MUE77_09890 [Sandarakinorhabdus sp.]|jgi:hypothetical protein|nr:hypothetical protein [Sandarakinorhabdus sp.]
MISRSTALGARNDQMVLFTLVELMTHLIFLALMLGLALRKEADPTYMAYQQDKDRYAALARKCGLDGSRCEVKTKAKGGQDLPNCLTDGAPLLRLRGLADGSIAVAPAGAVPAAIAGNALVAGMVNSQTMSLAAFGQRAGALGAATRKGAITGRACVFRATFCRAHNNLDLFDRQYQLAGQRFYLLGFPNACR